MLTNSKRELQVEPETGARASFARDGYLILDVFDFDPDAVVSAFSGRIKGASRVTDAWRREPPIRALANHPKILATLADLFGRDMAPFQTLNFDRGTQQPVHTDSMFFDTEPAGFMAGVWVALEDIDEDSGPLVFYPGSHQLARLTPQSVGVVAGKGFLYDEHLTPHLLRNIERLGLRSQRAILKQGQALIWHANLAHGGAPIHDMSRTRLSQVTHYMARGCRYVQPISSTPARPAYIQPTDIRTGKRHGSAPLSAVARQAAKNLLRWAPTS